MPRSVWNSRFADRDQDDVFENLNQSVGVDGRMFREEIRATRAHAKALLGAGIYDEDEWKAVDEALTRIEAEIAGGSIDLSVYEDIHTVVEHRLTDLTGDAGKRIQTGRSRNEQTVMNLRLFLKGAADSLIAATERLMAVLLDRAEAWVDVIFPGYTHQRPAQPIRFGFYLMAFREGLSRDLGRLTDARKRIDVSPSGVGALAGAPFGLDPAGNLDDLGFAELAGNALDAVSDRDGPVELLAALAMIQVRLSRLAEDLILWSAPAFGFLKLPAAYCTSSSLMPQKRNPDGLELVRGKAGRVVGDLTTLLVTLKGLPSGYQKDLQEDKEPLFDGVDTVLACLKICEGVVKGLVPDEEKMLAAVTPECLATDLADRLVAKGLPFREAYARVAACFDKGASPTPEELGNDARGGTAHAGRIDRPTERALRNGQILAVEEDRKIVTDTIFRGAKNGVCHYFPICTYAQRGGSPQRITAIPAIQGPTLGRILPITSQSPTSISMSPNLKATVP